MTEMNRPCQHTTTAQEDGLQPSPARRARFELATDAVVAAYINDISERQRRPRQVTDPADSG